MDMKSKVLSLMDNIELNRELAGLEINDIRRTNDENIWIASNNGAFMYDFSSDSYIHYVFENDKNSISSNIVLTIHESENGDIWLGTDGGGISIYSFVNQEFSQLETKHDPSVAKTSAQCIYDDGKRIWITTVLDGVKVMHKTSQRFKLLEDFHPDILKYGKNAILAFEEDTEGNIWIGTDGSGLYKYNPYSGEIQSFIHDPAIPGTISSSVVKTLLFDNKGNLYAGTYAGGLNLLPKGSNRFQHFRFNPNDETSISNDNAWSLHMDNSGNLWVGTLGGLNIFNQENKTFKRYLFNPNQENTYISKTTFNIFEDSKNRVWFASQDGICYYRPKTDDFKRFYPKDYELEDNFVNDLFEDKDKNLWFVTYKGIYKFEIDSNRIEPLKKLNDEITKSIQTVLVDRNNAFWVSSNYGIYKVDPKDEEVRHYDEGDGLQKREYHMGAKFIDSRGRFYFGGQGGVNIFRPDDIKYTKEVPNVVLTGLRLFLQPVSAFDQNNILFGDVHFQEKLQMKHKQNSISFEYAAMDFNVKKRNSFAYILEGFDEDWNYVEDMKLASYTNIPPGEYVFKVKTSNKDGVWSENSKNIELNIIAPFWMTTWFRIFGLIFVGGLIFGVYRYRTNLFERQKVKLQKMVDSRTGELEEMIELIKEKSRQISESGDTLKVKSGSLAKDAKVQMETAKIIEGDIDKVTQYTKKNSENANITNEISETIEKQLDGIKTATEKNIDAINRITQKVKILEDIFRQTNILSMNASVEAARVGDVGNGFAVIAEEVRKLALRSKQASQEIFGSAEEGAEETNHVGNLILDFIPEIQKSTQLIKEISSSSQEQNRTIENVNYSLRDFFKTSG